MKLTIKDADAAFLAALTETLDAMQASKDGGDDIESFVGTFPDMETPDLQWIRDKAREVLCARAGIAASPLFRYFRERSGQEWKVPASGDYVYARTGDKWIPLHGEIADFIGEHVPSGKFTEFTPMPKTGLTGSEIANLIQRGRSIIGECPYSEDGTAWISEAEDFLLRHGVSPATMNVAPMPSTTQGSSAFRYFRDEHGHEWRVPVSGGIGDFRHGEGNVWISVGKTLCDFIGSSVPIGRFKEFVPSPEIVPADEIATPEFRYFRVKRIPGKSITDQWKMPINGKPGMICFANGVGDWETSVSTLPNFVDDNGKILEGFEEFVPEDGNGASQADEERLDTPDASPTLQAHASQDQASS